MAEATAAAGTAGAAPNPRPFCSSPRPLHAWLLICSPAETRSGPHWKGTCTRARLSLPDGKPAPRTANTQPHRIQGNQKPPEPISVNNASCIEGYIFKISWIFMHGHAAGVCTVCSMYGRCVLQVGPCSPSFRPPSCNPWVIPRGKRSLLWGKGSSQAPSCITAGTARGRASLEAQTCRTDSVGFAGAATACVNWALCLRGWKGRDTRTSSKRPLSDKI